MGPVAISYMLVLSANANDEKNKSEIILNSLPISRSKIVFAKYLAVAVYIVLGLLLSGAVGAVLKNSGFFPIARYINAIDLVSVFLSVGLMSWR